MGFFSFSATFTNLGGDFSGDLKQKETGIVLS